MHLSEDSHYLLGLTSHTPASEPSAILDASAYQMSPLDESNINHLDNQCLHTGISTIKRVSAAVIDVILS
jgi:hypothetical protein